MLIHTQTGRFTVKEDLGWSLGSTTVPSSDEFMQALTLDESIELAASGNGLCVV